VIGRGARLRATIRAMRAAARISLPIACFALAACGESPRGAASPAAEAAPLAPPTSSPPRVVLVTLDTLSADRLGCYGGTDVATPRLDALAAAGVRFARAAVPMPQTAPSHASLLTGRYPLSHGLTDNWHALAPEVDTLAELLLKRGVETACFYNVFQFNEANLVQGFRKQVRDTTDEARDVVPRLLAWLDELPDGKPAFAWVHLFIAHTPFVPPEPYHSRYVKHDFAGAADFSVRTRLELLRGPGFPPDYAEEFLELYDAEVAFLDQRVGELLDGLEARGGLERTLVLFMADHGESRARATLGLHAFVTTQETLRVPFLVAGRGVARGRVVEELVENVDVAPTLLESFGHDPVELLGERQDGRSFWPLLRGDGGEGDGGDDGEPRVAFGSLPCAPGTAEAPARPEVVTAWQGRFKLVVTRKPGEGSGADGAEERLALYDADADPQETRDLAADHPEIVRALRRRIDDWLARTLARSAAAGPLSRAGQQMLQQLGYGDR
jgi:arylsulfatase A-like enzyme